MSENKVRLDYIADQIRGSGCTPVISNQLVLDMIFGKNGIARALAKEFSYPCPDNDTLSRVAQYLRVKEETSGSAPSTYLKFLKQHLLNLERQKPGADPAFLDSIAVQLKRLHFTELAVEHLKSFSCSREPPDNPLNALAALDIPVYLTTCHHCFLEKALAVIGKQPRTEVYRWHDYLNIPSEYEVDRTYEPSIERPLVYHLHGIESIPGSLVLTEDDELDFLVRIHDDFDNPEITPSSVRTQVETSVLLLLGYDVLGLDLRTVLKGFVEKSQVHQHHPLGIAIQIDPDERNASTIDIPKWREYLESFFKTVRIEVFWDSPAHFMAALWRELQ